MNLTWPYYHPLPTEPAPLPMAQSTSALVDDNSSDAAKKFVRDSYALESGDAKIEIWYRSSNIGLDRLYHLPTAYLEIVQAPQAIPFYEEETDLVLSSDPEDEDEVAPAYHGFHSHSLIFTHPLSLDIVRELRTIEALSYEEPFPIFIKITYYCGPQPVMCSRFLANYVRTDNLVHGQGVLTKNTVFQCYLAEVLQPIDPQKPVVSTVPGEEFNALLLQAAIHQEKVASILDDSEFEDDEDDESEDEDEEESEDE